ncbi:MAG: hypothetical protein PF693_18365 [Spirochaetia bacterium]|jgi:hypothetical protein|nr:hypothetical protein [Spirochaetia bacterium]
MHEKLWFVTNGISLDSVHTTKMDAEIEYQKYQDDPDFEYYDFYHVNVDDLEGYPDEYVMAFDVGFIG